jgi:hypothetical protein
MDKPSGQLKPMELRELASKARRTSGRLITFAIIWIAVVFFTFIPLPMPFTGWPMFLIYAGVPAVACVTAIVYHRQAIYYVELSRNTSA